MSAFKRLICVLLAAAALCSTLASCSGGHGVVSDDASDTSVFESESPSEHPSLSGETSGVIDLPWEIPEDIENPSQGLELAESYSKEFGDCYFVVGIGTCEDTDIVIPSTVDGKPVVEIANKAFWQNNKITSVYCGNRVTKIGKLAFQQCKKLKTVVIPDSVEFIGEEAFCFCNITSVEMGDNVKEMERGVFQMNKSLKSIKLSRALTNIPEDTFATCSALTEVELSPAIVNIEKQAFSGTAINSIRIPAIVKSIAANTFPKKLHDIIVDDNNPYYCSLDGVLFSKDMAELVCMPIGKKADYTVPDGVKIIDTRALMEVTYEITLPNSIRTIGETAFSGQYGGSYSVNIKKGVSYIEDFAFDCPMGHVTINYEGTEEEWNAIRKADSWYLPYSGIGDQTTTVKCSDGTLTFDYGFIY